MIIGDWRRRSTRKATELHLENDQIIFQIILHFSPKNTTPNSCVAGCQITDVILEISPNIPNFSREIKKSTGLCCTASPCCSRFQTNYRSPISRSLLQGGDRLSVRKTGFSSKHPTDLRGRDRLGGALLRGVWEREGGRERWREGEGERGREGK